MRNSKLILRKWLDRSFLKMKICSVIVWMNMRPARECKIDSKYDL